MIGDLINGLIFVVGVMVGFLGALFIKCRKQKLLEGKE